MKKFIALVLTAVIVITAMPVQPAHAGNNGAAIAAGIAGLVVGMTMGQHRGGYGGGMHMPGYGRPYCPPRVMPRYVQPQPFVFNYQWNRPQLCRIRDTWGRPVWGPCPTFRAYGGQCIQIPGRGMYCPVNR